MTVTRRNILGTGLDYGFRFDTGKSKTASEELSVESAIKHLLSTPKGTRFMLPEFGTELYTLLFDANDDATLQLAEVYVEEAIREWIPRVETVTVTALSRVAALENKIGYNADFATQVTDENTIVLVIRYTTRKSPEINTMVYPFYTQTS